MTGVQTCALPILTKPALVQILPNSDRLTWKLTERGELSTSIFASQPAIANHASIDPLALTRQIEHIVQAKLRSSHRDILNQCQELIDRSSRDSTDRANSNVDSTSQSIIQGAMVAKEYAKRANQFAQKGLEYAKSALSSEDRPTTQTPPTVMSSQTSSVMAEDCFIKAKEKEQKNDLIGALLYYDRAIELDPEHANAYFNRGMLKKNSSLEEDKADAIKSLRTAARLYKQQGKLDIYKSLSETLQKLVI